MLKASLQLRLGQSLTMTPQLQQAIRLLQLPTIELQAHIREALESNVMLEQDEEAEAATFQPLAITEMGGETARRNPPSTSKSSMTAGTTRAWARLKTRGARAMTIARRISPTRAARACVITCCGSSNCRN